MKKLTILILAIGLLSMYSCKKDDKVELTGFTSATVTFPTQGSAFTLLEANKDELMCTFTWLASPYSPSNLVPPVYTLEMDTAGHKFADPKVLTSSAGLTYPITVGAMNAIVLSKFEGQGGVAGTFEFRVKSQLSGTGSQATQISETLTLTITPYSTIVIVPPIYLLGDATTAGWDNTKALEMTHIEGGKFAIVETLAGAGKGLKFIADLGAWAPQWGTDATGTSELGPLVYRPTESVPDPAQIPSPAEVGDYYILADTALLTYEISATSAQLFLVGAATTAGWDNTKGIPFEKLSPGIFQLTTTLTTGGMKFLEVSGQWAPQWGTDATGSPNDGPLIYRPTESVPDPAEIPSPGAGTYTIKVNLITKSYKIQAGK
ncbi:MAG TPA: SusF/SusE family outer membrane protein [Bacteroidales bacterium]|nr:SusF/SusE family outer membrane protein [Bacteroidales bacterium]